MTTMLEKLSDNISKWMASIFQLVSIHYDRTTEMTPDNNVIYYYY